MSLIDGVEPEERPEEEEVEMSEAKFLKKSQFDLDIDFEKEKQIMKEELRDNVAVLGRLLKPLEGLRRYTLDVGDCLKGMKYNLDFAKLVQVIDRDLNDLNEQILARKNFYLFVMVSSLIDFVFEFCFILQNLRCWLDSNLLAPFF